MKRSHFQAIDTQLHSVLIHTIQNQTHHYPYNQQQKYFQVVGRKIPTETDQDPEIYRMRVFAPNPVTAKSRFWYFLHKLHKLKKTTGEILSVNEIFERKTSYVKNYGVWLRYNSRSGTHNMYKEFRDTSLVGAVNQLYSEMASRHRARDRSIQVIRVEEIDASDCRRDNVTQFHNSAIKFPLAHRIPRASNAQVRTTFKANRPTTFFS